MLGNRGQGYYYPQDLLDPYDPYGSYNQAPQHHLGYIPLHPTTSGAIQYPSYPAPSQQANSPAPPSTMSGSQYDSHHHRNDSQATLVQTNNALYQVERFVDRPTVRGQRVGVGSKRRELAADHEYSNRAVAHRYSDFERARYEIDPNAQYRPREVANYYAQNPNRLTTHPGQDAPAPKPDAEERRIARRKREADAEAEKIAKIESYAARVARSQNPFQGDYVPAPPGYYYQTPAQGTLNTNKRDRTPEYDEDGNELDAQPRKKRRSRDERRR